MYCVYNRHELILFSLLYKGNWRYPGYQETDGLCLFINYYINTYENRRSTF